MAHGTTHVEISLAESIRQNASGLGAAIVRAQRGAQRGVHRARVATRRLREALASAEAMGMDVGADRRALRRLGRALGPVREMDVVRLELAECAVRFRWPVVPVARVDARCARHREAARRNLDDVLDRLEWPALVARLRETAGMLDRGATGMTPNAVPRSRVRDRARDLARAIRAAGTVYAAGPLHAVRIAAKKLRYRLELETGLGAAAPGAIRQLKRLQGLLGHLHDVQTLQHQLHGVASASADRRVARALTAMDRDLETRCREWHGKVLALLPRIRITVATLAEAAQLGPKASVPATDAPSPLAARRRPARMRADRALPRVSSH